MHQLEPQLQSLICFLILLAEISTVLCDNQKKAETMLQNREKGQTPVLKTIIIMDAFSPEIVERGAKCGVDVLSMQDTEVMQTTVETVHDLHLLLKLLTHTLCTPGTGEKQPSRASCKFQITNFRFGLFLL